MITIQTRSGEIIMVEVPGDSKEYDIWNGILCYDKKLTPNEKLSGYTIIGTITNGTPDFDTKEYVQGTGGITKISRGGMWFLDYTILNEKSFTLEFSDDSFKTLLNSHKADLTKKWVCLRKNKK